MPLLIINMGGEMAYILQQRLVAQKIPEAKSSKVLHDVIRTMYNKNFINALFDPQMVYSNESVRQVFDRLAHSSIMRLNENSMDKLYDLMSLGFKYQILRCFGPEQFIDITLNHLENLYGMVTAQDVIALLDNAKALVNETYSNMSQGNLNLLKQTLFGFFEDRKVKVSIFLQQKVQNSDGTFKIFLGGPVSDGGEIPGTMRIYGGNRSIIHETTDPFDWAEGCRPPLRALCSNLGNNMYANEDNPNLEPVDPKKLAKSLSGSKQGEKSHNRTNGNERSPVQRVKPSVPYNDRGVKASPSSQTAGRAELNLLANLLGRAVEETEGKSGDSSDNNRSKFTLNLNFDNSIFGETGIDKGERVPHRVSIDAKATRKSMQQQMADLGFDDEDEDSSLTGGARKRNSGNSKENSDSEDDDSEDDLLDLMDMASKK